MIRLFLLFFLMPLFLMEATSGRYPIRKELIVLDPGHGGDDRGTVSTQKPILLEKRLTLFTTNLVRSALHGFGYQTLMTRLKDETVSLDQRVAFSNDVKPTCFVSIHFNAAPSPQAKGIEIFVYKEGGATPRLDASEALAKSILKHLLQWTGADSRGVKSDNFRVIKDNHYPAVLVEAGFLSHPEEAKLLGQPLYLKKVAMGIAKGIDDYLSSRRLPTR
jgi:N-acetylmuramoyl-L-alanine amidase